MAKIFLDVNYLIGLANRAPETDTSILDDHACMISALSCHILFYVNKIKVPSPKTDEFLNDFNLIDLKSNILNKSASGPTTDFEDNVQLHSAAEADCDIFLTADRNLLKMKFFGKTKILPNLKKP